MQSSRPAFGGQLTFGVSLRKTRFIQPHALFTGIYLLKRLSAGFLVSCRASPFGAAPVFSFFASSAPPPWRSAFSRFALVVNLGLPVLASVANRSVKPTCLRQAAYFRSLWKMKNRVGKLESELFAFIKKYSRKAQRRTEPNDRRYDRKIEKWLKTAKLDEVSKILT